MYRSCPALPLSRLARIACAGGLAALFASAPAARAAAPAFGLEQVAERARELASRPYEDPRGQVPKWLLDLSYDQWRQIRFRPELAAWREKKLAFSVQFFHPGLFYDRRIVVHEVDSSGVREMGFSPEESTSCTTIMRS